MGLTKQVQVLGGEAGAPHSCGKVTSMSTSTANLSPDGFRIFPLPTTVPWGEVGL